MTSTIDPHTARKTLKLFWSYWVKKPVNFYGALMLAPAYALQFVVTPLFVTKSISQLVSGQSVDIIYPLLAALSLTMGILLSHIAQYYFQLHINAEGITAIHNTSLKLLLGQDYAFFANNFGGALVARASRMAKAFEQFTYVTFIEMLGLLTSVMVALGIMIFLSPLLGAALAAVWVTSMVLITYLTLKRMPLRKKMVAQESIQTGELADIVTNAVTVKTFAREAAEQARYQQTNNKRSGLLLDSWEAAGRNVVMVNVLCGVLQMLVLVGGIWAIQRGEINVATFLLFQVYILRAIDSIQKVGSAVRHYENALGDAHEMTELFDRLPAILDPKNPEPSRIKKGAIALQDVQFSYADHKNDQQAETLLNAFTLKIAPGEKIGLVGPSGGGKTTLTKLLLRFADIQSGAIVIDGQDIRAIKQDDLHRAISYVPQEPMLFHRTIKENIGYGNPNATDAQIIAAAKQAHAHDFIYSLPHGYETLVGERGIKLSGGQRQRIALARAMLKKAPILVLDEATSALDSESEHYIQQSLWQLMEGKTAIVIAHRLSTIQKLDRIVVLDKGNIVEQGTHTQLLEKKNGLYSKLWKHQSGGFIDD